MEGIKAQGLNISDVDKKLVTLMAEQIFHTGFVHADPHPGNGIIFLLNNIFEKTIFSHKKKDGLQYYKA